MQKKHLKYSRAIIENSQKDMNRRELPQLDTEQLQTTKANILYSGDWTHPSETVSQEGMSTLTMLILHSGRCSSQCSMSRKGNKRHTRPEKKKKKKTVPIFLFYVKLLWHDCLCRQPKEDTHTQKLRISEFSKVTGYKTTT